MRSLWFFNVLLALVCALLVEALASTLLGRPSILLGEGPAVREARSAPAASKPEAEEAAARPEAPPLASFAVVVERDLFRNPYPEPTAPPAASRPAPPPAPLPALIGTIFVDQERRAVLRDGNKTEVYRLGQAVAGGTLTAIEADRVTIQRPGGAQEVLLKASIQAGPAPPRSPAKAEPEGAPRGALPATPPSPQAVPAQEGDPQRYRQEVMTPEERLRRLRESYIERRRGRGL